MYMTGNALVSFWICFAVFVGGMLGLAWYCRRYMRGVADFLSANRMARKYLMTVSMGMTGGAGMVAAWQMYYNSGLSAVWWDQVGVPTGLVISVTGFVIYRFRETRSLTLGQFFEMRYGRAFRNYAGYISFFSGVINHGVIPLVAADLIVNTLGISNHFQLWGITLNTTFCIMGFNLLAASMIACWGGQISIMLTDFYQEVFCKVLFCLMICILLRQFFWPELFNGLSVLNAQGSSLVDPFNSSKAEFNVWYFLIGLYGHIYNAKSWQGGAGYSTSAKTPHDAQMAGVLGRWRHLGMLATYMIPALIAYGVMHNSAAFPQTVEKVQTALANAGTSLADGKAVTAHFMALNLPPWIWGAFAAMLFACILSSDDTALHSWSSILVQDIILPRVKTRPTPKRHLLYLRLAILGIALFSFIYGCFFPKPQFLYQYFAITGAIYLGGAGIVIFGGLYWRRGTTAGAFSGMTAGCVLAVLGLGLEMFWVNIVRFLSPMVQNCSTGFGGWLHQFLLDNPERFVLKGQTMYFYAMLAATIIYWVVSLATSRKPFNLEQLLHRGEYAVASEEKFINTGKKTWKERIGFSKEFNKPDAFLFWFTIGYCLFWWVVFLVGIIAFYVLKIQIPLHFWKWYWGIYLAIQVLIMVIATTWLTIGGLHDAYKLPQDLKEHMSSADDDGSVAPAK